MFSIIFFQRQRQMVSMSSSKWISLCIRRAAFNSKHEMNKWSHLEEFGLHWVSSWWAKELLCKHMLRRLSKRRKLLPKQLQRKKMSCKWMWKRPIHPMNYSKVVPGIIVGDGAKKISTKIVSFTETMCKHLKLSLVTVAPRWWFQWRQHWFWQWIR